MNEISRDRVGPMPDPPHLGELIRESVDETGWNVTGTAASLLNGRAVVSANMALEEFGWNTAEHWMRMQASYDLAQARWDRVKRRPTTRISFH